MELKFEVGSQFNVTDTGSNCTFMELKYAAAGVAGTAAKF